MCGFSDWIEIVLLCMHTTAGEGEIFNSVLLSIMFYFQ